MSFLMLFIWAIYWFIIMNFEINYENLFFTFAELLQCYFNQKFWLLNIWIIKYAKLKSQDIIKNSYIYY